MSRQPQALDYTSGTISNSAVNIFEMGSALISSAPVGARSFVGTIEEAAVRARGDGSAPTDTEGQLIGSGDVVYLGESEFSSMEFIRDTSTDSKLRGHFYNVEVDVILGKVS
jgi:hypothetical protein|tara:strand:+ start:30 stop:365 length:336 start_codon:yes stop_codon:yes gene_type:complete